MAETVKTTVTSKNQTAAARALQRAQDGLRASSRFCESSTCPAPKELILIKDLLAVKWCPRGSRGRMRFFHISCELS